MSSFTPFRNLPCVLLFLLCLPCFAVTVTPSTTTLQENASQQFTTSTPSTWTTNCGAISSTGLFRAPLYPKVCTLTATASDGSGTATASVNVVSPIIMSPAAANTPQGQTQQFTANMPVTWVAACGSITSAGLYTASATVGTFCTVEGISTGTPKYTVYGYDKIGPPSATTFSLTPLSPNITEGATQQFTASVSATFTATCGTISATGLYTAPLIPTHCTIAATAIGGSGSATAIVNVVSPITITPASTTTAQGKTQQFTASAPVAWSTTCGTITAGGLFTATAPVGTQCTIQATALGSPQYTVFGSDTIGPAASATFSITPLNPTVNEAAAQQFTASATSTWTTNCGTISAAGVFQAPLYPKLCTVTATATDGSGSATTNVNVISPVVMTPVSATTPQGLTQQFTASMPVSWVAACGTITGAGLYTANAPTVGTHCTVEGISTGTPKYTVYGYDTIGAPIPIPLSIAPLNSTVVVGATQQFTATTGATFAATCGSISTTGLYTAPITPGVCSITATATNGSNQTASALVNVTSTIVISPTSSRLFALGTQPFIANVPVTWSATCGTIDVNTGKFTAPNTDSTCTVTATSSSGSALTATADVSVSKLNYTTFQGNNARNGIQTRERVLTPSNVNSSSFGVAWSMTLDGGIWTQPLYMNALTVNGAPHNVVFETTSNDSVYAIDADSGSLLWQRSFLSPGVTAVAGSSILSSMNPVGIVGTPVIDPDSSTMYVVAMTAENNNTVFIHRLHAIDLTTGQDLPNSPATFSAPGFDDTKQMQRAALLLANSRVYVAFGGIADRPPYQGFLFAFDTDTLGLSGVFADDPVSSSEGGGGIWMSGMGPSVDEEGNIYLTTGNGFADGVSNFGQSVIKLSPDLEVRDYFTPFDHVAQSVVDGDLGSGGALLVPDQPGPFRHEIITCGKLMSIYVLNRDQLGGLGTSSDNIIQRVDNQIGQTGNFRDSGHACFSTPAVWHQNVYFIPNRDVMKMFTLDPNTGLLSSTPASQGTFTYAWPGAYPAISSNDDSNGIVWTYEFATGTLRATDASDVSKELYVGSVFPSTKWSVPTIVNGHVYVEAQNKIFAFATH